MLKTVKREAPNHEPILIFGLSPDHPPVTTQSELWSAPLPASRHAFGHSPNHNDAFGGTFTYGDYFSAVRQFLAQDHFALLCQAAGSILGRRVTSSEMDRIAVYLVKHGAFYHPARIVVTIRRQHLSFVLNVAISAAGQRIIHQEFQSLSHLNSKLSLRYWPAVYGIGAGAAPAGPSIPMFLGQWLAGFFEFHLSGADKDQLQLVVWDTDQGHRRLTGDQVMDCLRQAARILSYAYNPLTFEAIGPWHHAAGDFVVAADGDTVDVRLITVRNYSPEIENPEPDVAFVLEALLVLWVKLSLKLRLDRRDGVGSVVCHGTDVVGPICRGFFEGLKSAAAERGLPKDFDTSVKEFLALQGADQLISLGADIIQKVFLNADERDLLAPNLESHVGALKSALFA